MHPLHDHLFPGSVQLRLVGFEMMALILPSQLELLIGRLVAASTTLLWCIPTCPIPMKHIPPHRLGFVETLAFSAMQAGNYAE